MISIPRFQSVNMPAVLAKGLFIAALLVMGFSATAVLAAGQVGEPAPDFALTNSLGELVEISFGQGEVFLLNFIGYS